VGSAVRLVRDRAGDYAADESTFSFIAKKSSCSNFVRGSHAQRYSLAGADTLTMYTENAGIRLERIGDGELSGAGTSFKFGCYAQPTAQAPSGPFVEMPFTELK
jgi:hypothetical protein